MQRLNGIGVSAGVAVGRALVWKRAAREVRFLLPPDSASTELARLAEARERSRRQLAEIKSRIARTAGAEHAYLFDAQLLMLDDPMLIARAEELIGRERLNAEWAVRRAADELSAIFRSIEDPYLRERKGDVADLVGRLSLNLRAGASGPVELFNRLTHPHVLVADDLPPSVAAQIDWSVITGFVTDAGSWTYHTAILARSLHVPAVVGLHDASVRVPPGAPIAIDGSTGEVLLEPSEAMLTDIGQRRRRRAAHERELYAYRQVAAVTADGARVRIEANLERPEDLVRARDAGAEGIGLFRSEFLLAGGAQAALDEDTQVDAYRALLEGMAPAPVTIRTFDVGQDRFRHPGGRAGDSDRLGLRAIRFSLANPEVFRTQLRALLRAAPAGRLRVLFPFVSGVEELREARGMLRDEASRMGAPERAAEIPVGAMIEVPAAAVTVDLLAREADFLSVGTNDLIQYCLAVDRTDDRVSHLYAPLHPAILRLIRLVQRAGRRARVPVTLCGEMASDPILLALLIGLGVDRFSMTPGAIPAAKHAIRDVDRGAARALAADALRCGTVQEIEQRLAAYIERQRVRT